jgi:hypothetical protein
MFTGDVDVGAFAWGDGGVGESSQDSGDGRHEVGGDVVEDAAASAGQMSGLS